jgi:hypothetical protein
MIAASTWGESMEKLSWDDLHTLAANYRRLAATADAETARILIEIAGDLDADAAAMDVKSQVPTHLS